MSKVGVCATDDQESSAKQVEMQPIITEKFVSGRRRGIRKQNSGDQIILEEQGTNAFTRSFRCDCRALSVDKVFVLNSVNMSLKHMRKHVVNERKILDRIQQKGHPGIIRLWGVNEDKLKIHGDEKGDECNMVFDFMDRGNMYYVVQDALKAATIEQLDETDGSASFTSHPVFSDNVLANIAKQQLSALKFLHDNRIIHRDIKPDNVLLNSNGEIKLKNFGCGALLQPNELFTDGFKGTSYYWSPEIAQQSKYSFEVDVWAFGLTMIYFATGIEPTSTLNREELRARIVNDQAPSLGQEFNPLLRNFVHKCMQKDPQKRASVSNQQEDDFITTYAAEGNLFSWPKSLNMWTQNSLNAGQYNHSARTTLVQELQQLGQQRLEELRPDLAKFVDISGNTLLHAAAKLHNIEQVQRALDMKVPIDASDINGETALFIAAQTDDVNIATLLLENKANVDDQNDGEATALLMACMYGYLESGMVNLQLAHKADVNLSDMYGMAPLHAAAELGFLDIAACLLDHQADVNQRNIDQGTPLICATQAGHEKLTTLLLNHNAYVNHVDEYKMSSLLYAAKKKQTAIVSSLIQNHANVNFVGKLGYSALLYVARQGDVDSARQLLENKADVNIQCSEFGFSPLMFAASNGNVALCELLYSYKAMHDQKDKDKQTALHWAVKNGQLDTVKFLVNLNADVDGKNSDGYSVMLLAAMGGHNDILHFLLSLQKEAVVPVSKKNSLLLSLKKKKTVFEHVNVPVIDVDLPSSDNYTALILACRENHRDTVSLLLQHKADVLLQDRCKRSALMWAAVHGKLDIAELLIDTYREQLREKHVDEDDQEDNVEDLVNQTNDEGFTPLLLAAEQGHASVVKLLLQNKAKLRHYDDILYQTAWDLAKLNNHQNVLEVQNKAYRDDRCCSIM